MYSCVVPQLGGKLLAQEASLVRFGEPAGLVSSSRVPVYPEAHFMSNDYKNCNADLTHRNLRDNKLSSIDGLLAPSDNVQKALLTL